MARETDLDSLAAFVEEVGDLFDQMGQQRIAGRIVGWLLVCDPPEQSAAELCEAVGASKASVSTVVRGLLISGLLERLGQPGSRRTYYRVKPGAWTGIFVAKMRFTEMFHEVAQRGLELVADDPGRRGRLEEMARFYGFFCREMDRLLERWNQENRSDEKHETEPDEDDPP